MNLPVNRLIKQGSPESFGWMRRKDKDTSVADAWELPDGTLFAVTKGRKIVLQRLGNLPPVIRKTP